MIDILFLFSAFPIMFCITKRIRSKFLRSSYSQGQYVKVTEFKWMPLRFPIMLHFLIIPIGNFESIHISINILLRYLYG